MPPATVTLLLQRAQRRRARQSPADAPALCPAPAPDLEVALQTDVAGSTSDLTPPADGAPPSPVQAFQLADALAMIPILPPLEELVVATATAVEPPHAAPVSADPFASLQPITPALASLPAFGSVTLAQAARYLDESVELLQAAIARGTLDAVPTAEGFTAEATISAGAVRQRALWARYAPHVSPFRIHR